MGGWVSNTPPPLVGVGHLWVCQQSVVGGSLNPPPPPSVDTTKTRSGPQRVRMSSGERPMGAAKGKQSDTEALCQPPPPPPPALRWSRKTLKPTHRARRRVWVGIVWGGILCTRPIPSNTGQRAGAGGQARGRAPTALRASFPGPRLRRTEVLPAFIWGAQGMRSVRPSCALVLAPGAFGSLMDRTRPLPDVAHTLPPPPPPGGGLPLRGARELRRWLRPARREVPATGVATGP